MTRPSLAVLVALLAAACAGESAPEAAPDPSLRAIDDSAAAARPPARVIAPPAPGAPAVASPDGGRRLAAAVAEFRRGLSPVDSLADAAPSRDALVARFATALARRDEAALRRLALTRAEFAYLYHPTNPQALPPYELDPQTMWLMMEQQSARGATRVLRRYGGGGARRVAGHRCDDVPQRHRPDNLVWVGCRVRLVGAGGDTVESRLFGSVLERGGRFKLVSLANEL